MPSPDPVVERINALILAASGELRSLDIKTNKSLAFYMGDGHWRRWDQPFPVAPIAFEGERRITINKFAESFDRRYAKLLAGQPIASVIPATGEVQDLRSAKLCERGLEWGWQVAEGEEKYAQWIWWGMHGPRSWTKFVWDPTLGRAVQRPMMNKNLTTGQPMGMPVMGQDGKPMMQELHEGLPGIVVRSHYEMIWDPYATWEGDARWCIEVNLVSCDEVKKRYGIRPEPDTENAGDRFWRRRFLDQLRGGTGTAAWNSGPEEEVCELREMWEIPSEAFPGGRKVVATKQEVLDDGPHPYDHKMLPYVGFSERRIGGSLYGECVGWRLFDPSQELNIHHSQVREHCDIASNPPWVEERGQNSTFTKMEGGRSGVRVTYEQTMAPVPGFGHTGTLSPDVWRYGEQIERDLAELGEIPFLAARATGETSGRALSERIEEDDSVLGPSRQSIKTALTRGYKMMLDNFRQFMPAPRIIRVVGKEHTIAVHKFSAEDVRPDFDVMVGIESASRTSKALKTEAIMKLAPMVLQHDPSMALELVRALPVGGLERVWQRASIHTSFSERQIERVSMTKDPEPVRAGEDVGKSIAVWDPFLLSEDFEMLDEQAKAALLATYEEKTQALAKQRQAEMMMQAVQNQMAASAKGRQAAAAGKPTPRGMGSEPESGEVF